MAQQEFVMDDRSGLVLEGGGMRGVFTCGVLDSLMDRGVRFPYAIGVSAGACNGLSYVSGQRGRAKYSNIDLMAKYNYISIKHLLLRGNIMDFDLLFDEFPNRIIPYDYDAMKRGVTRFEMVTTDCITGQAYYLEERNDPQRVIAIVKASSSLPFVSPISYVDGRPMSMAVWPTPYPLPAPVVRVMARLWWCSHATRAIARATKPLRCRGHSTESSPR